MLVAAVSHLAAVDPALAALRDRNGLPPLWSRPPGFATLIRFILEQQVSLASADAAYRRLEGAINEVAPREFLTLDDAELRRIGFSRQKTGYGRGVAEGMLDGSIELQHLEALADNEVMETLEAIRGVGSWTASCYLLFVLQRPDAWPPGDRALQVSMADVLELDEVPDRKLADAIAERWRPYRAVAARMLWHEYLGGAPVRAALR
jgi:DNA-3-methyladenine glycosylase II